MFHRWSELCCYMFYRSSYFWFGLTSNGEKNIKTNVAHQKTVLGQHHPITRQMLEDLFLVQYNQKEPCSSVALQVHLVVLYK